MTLTAAQLALRARGLGASEIAAVCGVDPHRGPVDVWVRKWRGAALDIPPELGPEDVDAEQAEDGEDGAVDARTVGHALEPVIASLYAARTGADLWGCDTLTGPEPWQLATPDRLALRPAALDTIAMPDRAEVLAATSHGLECKAVGARMMARWDDGVPSYVQCQAQWSMHVTGLARWDVAALIGGTTFRYWTLDRDADSIATMVEAAGAFWHENILGNRVPTDLGQARRSLRDLVDRRWPRDDGLEVAAPEEAALLVSELARVKEESKSLGLHEQQLTDQLCLMVGQHGGITGPWGKFSYRARAGNPQWKAIAEALAGGAVPEELVDAHRAPDIRATRLTIKKARKT